ncbi:MAG TPA: serine hydrolase domain-containing protein, partial [Blastocatellia bacterium]|nr:serine hydrolase domain-containing protein [Blastocatellia bacterium]
MSVNYRFLFACLVLLMAVTSLAQDTPVTPTASLRDKDAQKQIINRLDATIPRLLEEGLVPGLSIALIQKGELVWHKGYGVKNAQTKEPVVANTTFEAASLSK